MIEKLYGSLVFMQMKVSRRLWLSENELFELEFLWKIFLWRFAFLFFLDFLSLFPSIFSKNSYANIFSLLSRILRSYDYSIEKAVYYRRYWNSREDNYLDSYSNISCIPIRRSECDDFAISLQWRIRASTLYYWYKNRMKKSISLVIYFLSSILSLVSFLSEISHSRIRNRSSVRDGLSSLYRCSRYWNYFSDCSESSRTILNTR